LFLVLLFPSVLCAPPPSSDALPGVPSLPPVLLHLARYVTVDDEPMEGLLGTPLLGGYAFALPEYALRAGTAYVGSNHRLRRGEFRGCASASAVATGLGIELFLVLVV
jgi:hypothetical protein